MMLIIADKNPYKAVEYLIDHTNIKFVFKQLIELCQLICSTGISDVYKTIKQGKKLQQWILDNKEFVFVYYFRLFNHVKYNVNISSRTWVRMETIMLDLYYSCTKVTWCYPKSIIFRYNKNYEAIYESNTELPADIAVREYKKYLKWKFKKGA